MAHFGLLPYQGVGHLNPLFALSQRLIARGHRVTVFQHRHLEEKVRLHGLEFFPVEASSVFDRGRISARAHSPRSASWITDVRSRVRRVNEEMLSFLRFYPVAIQAAKIDALLIGEISLAGPTAAEILRLPYFIVSTTIPHNFGWSAPRHIRPEIAWRERLRKSLLEVSVLRMHGPVRRSLDRYRAQTGLKSIRRINKTFPALAHLTQWPKCLDVPHRSVPLNFFYTGPFVDNDSRLEVPFLWERLDGRPLVYVSLGTTRNGDTRVLEHVARACEQLNLQAVITFGGTRHSTELPQFPGNTLVVSYAPQLELLKRADIVVTHAGPNTTLEALMLGKPMLAFPLTLDQPAVAAALERLGVAEVLSSRSCSTDQVRDALLKLRHNSRYRLAAQSLQQQLCARDGLNEAVQIIENKLAELRSPR